MRQVAACRKQSRRAASRPAAPAAGAVSRIRPGSNARPG